MARVFRRGYRAYLCHPQYLWHDISYAAYWRAYHAKRRLFKAIAKWAGAKAYYEPQCITGTNLPNVPFLRVVSITVENGYGQQHSHEYPENIGWSKKGRTNGTSS